jgi:hypothetical protein
MSSRLAIHPFSVPRLRRIKAQRAKDEEQYPTKRSDSWVGQLRRGPVSSRRSRVDLIPRVLSDMTLLPYPKADRHFYRIKIAAPKFMRITGRF